MVAWLPLSVVRSCISQDHDFLIDREDLLRYGNHALTYRIVDRIFSQAPRRFVSGLEGKMGYEDFCWFILVRRLLV